MHASETSDQLFTATFQLIVFSKALVIVFDAAILLFHCPYCISLWCLSSNYRWPLISDADFTASMDAKIATRPNLAFSLHIDPVY